MILIPGIQSTESRCTHVGIVITSLQSMNKAHVHVGNLLVGNFIHHSNPYLVNKESNWPKDHGSSPKPLLPHLLFPTKHLV